MIFYFQIFNLKENFTWRQCFCFYDFPVFSVLPFAVLLSVTKTERDSVTEQNPRFLHYYPARALRALGLLLADGTPTGGRGEDFLTGQPDFFTETAVTPERKVEKSFPRWEINRHAEG